MIAELEKKRKRMNVITAKMIKLMARRDRLSAEIGSIKRKAGKRIADSKREKSLIGFAKRAAKKYGTSPETSERVMKILISRSKKLQRRKND